MADDHHILRLRGPADLEKLSKAVAWCANKLGQGWTVIITRKRSVEQNARFHAMLADIAAQATWDGLQLAQDDWKELLVHGWVKESTGGGQRMVVNWQRDGIIALGQRTRNLSVSQMSELIEFVAFAGASLGVTFKEDKGETE
jgi:hypothetical protein